MKKLNKNGFGHIEVFIVVAAFALIGIIGSFVWQNSKSKSSQAEQKDARDWHERTVYCSYVQCHLRPGAGKAERTRWVRVSANGYQTCRETGIVWVKSANRPSSRTTGVCLAL